MEPVDLEIWQDLLEAERAFYRARQVFMRRCRQKGATLREAISKPSQRGTALRVALILEPEDLKPLFEVLIEQAGCGHADIGLVRSVILKIPHEWLLNRIEAVVDARLDETSEEDFRRYLELYLSIDRDLTVRLAERARGSADPEISEAGSEFLEKAGVRA